MSIGLDTKTIYEIFRACRLCGAGGGYKMPIIPSVVGFECVDTGLRLKIRDCVQIEVKQDDKMPPLICELCVDKIEDFYEFREMCHETNAKTRQRLGLPEPYTQNIASENSDNENCILGVTEPVYTHDDDDEPLIKRGPQKQKKRDEKTRGLLKELETLKQENSYRDARSPRDPPSRPTRHRRSPTPPRETRQSTDKSDNLALSRLKDQHKKSDAPKPKPMSMKMKDEVIDLDDDEPDEFLVPRGKRTRTSDSKDVPIKKIKLTVKEPMEPPAAVAKPRAGPKCSKRAESPAPKLKPGPKSAKVSSPKAEPPVAKPGPRSSKASSAPVAPSKVSKPPTAITCTVCESVSGSSQGLASHMRGTHTVRYTPPELACNACGEWFKSNDEASAHHKQHKSRSRPYKCRGCGSKHNTYSDYTLHVTEAKCVPWEEVPDVKCHVCFREYPTETLLRGHRCMAAGGKCGNCNKGYATVKSLRRHEKDCAIKKKGSASGNNPLQGIRVAPSVRARLKVARVLTAPCDGILGRGRCKASRVPDDFGLDRNSVYPYRSLVHVKREPLAADGMVSIHKDLPDQLYIEEDYVHWDSDNSNTSDEENSLIISSEKKKKVRSLTNLTLKTLFSKQCLGKVPRKFRKVRQDKFDSFFNQDSEFDNVQNDVNDIIKNLDDLGDDNVETESLSCITDVKSIKKDDDTVSLMSNRNSETNYESDSLLDDNSEANCVNVDADAKINEVNNDNDLQIGVNGLDTSLINKHMNVSADNGSETDASVDDNIDNTISRVAEDNNIDENNTEKIEKGNDLTETIPITENESIDDTNSQAAEVDKIDENNTEKIENGNDLTETVPVTENQMELINEISELYDKNALEQLDVQVNKSTPDIDDKSDCEKILLQDLMPENNVASLSLDNVSDEEFNFDS